MTWPTTPVSTANLDAGSDEPRLARADLKQAVDNVNAISSEFGNVAITSAVNGQFLKNTGSQWVNANVDLDVLSDVTITSAANNQIIQRSGNVWVNQYPSLTRYTESTATVSPTTGTVNVDWNNGNQQELTMTGNVTLGFVNAPTSGTITVIVNTNAANRAITFANTAKFAGNVRTISTSNVTDVIVATTSNSGGSYLISIVKGFV